MALPGTRPVKACLEIDAAEPISSRAQRDPSRAALPLPRAVPDTLLEIASEASSDRGDAHGRLALARTSNEVDWLPEAKCAKVDARAREPVAGERSLRAPSRAIGAPGEDRDEASGAGAP